MEIHQLEYLVAIADYKTILNAAEHLHVSQPSITKAIKKLEDEFGFKLFDRVKNRLVLNEYGNEAVKKARIILNDLAEFNETVNELYQSTIKVRIASIAPAPLWGLENLIHSKVEDQLYDNTERMLEDFKKNLYSLMIIDYPINDVDLICKKICDEQLYVAVNTSHVLASKKSITFEELDGYNFLLLNNVGYWYEISKENLPMSKFLTQNNIDTYNILSQSTDIPIFRTNLTIPYFKEKENKVYIPISSQDAKLSFYGIYRKTNKDLYDDLFEKVNQIDWKESYGRK